MEKDYYYNRRKHYKLRHTEKSRINKEAEPIKRGTMSIMLNMKKEVQEFKPNKTFFKMSKKTTTISSTTQ